jgi:hypothetical protein
MSGEQIVYLAGRVMGRKLQNKCFHIKKKPPESGRTVRSPQNIETVRQSFIRNPRRSARRYFVALEIFGCRLRRILHKDPYSMVVEQELSDRDMANRSTVDERLIGILS